MTNKQKENAILTKMAGSFFRYGIPNPSSIKNKKLKKYIMQEIKRRRILEIQHNFKKKKFKNLNKKSLTQLEKILKNPLLPRKTKKRRLSKKRRTRKLSKK